MILFSIPVICQTINRTYQTITRQELQLALGHLNGKHSLPAFTIRTSTLLANEFELLIKTRGWKAVSDDASYIWIANHEENIKSRNIVEKIKFERELSTLYLTAKVRSSSSFRCRTGDEHCLNVRMTVSVSFALLFQ